MKKGFFGLITLLILSSLIAGLFWFGGNILLIGMVAMFIVGIMSASFWMGTRWTKTLITEGANLVIEATNQNDRLDIEKIKTIRTALGNAPPPHSMLPPSNGEVTGFVIEGLDE